MDWLCEVTPEELVRVGRRTNTMGELEAAVRKYVITRIKRRNIYDPGHFLRIRQWGGHLQKGTILYQVWRNDRWLLVTKSLVWYRI